MRSFKLIFILYMFHLTSSGTDFATIDYSGVWNLSYEVHGMLIKKNEILITKTANTDSGAVVYSVRGYLNYEEILAMIVRLDEEDGLYKISWITLNTERPYDEPDQPGPILGDIDYERFTIANSSSTNVLNLTTEHGIIHNATLSKKFSFQ